MKVYETQLPGVGIRYTLRFEGGREFVVLTRNDGSSEVYWRTGRDSDSDRLFTLDEDDARKLSDILEGTYFHPVDEGLDDVFENARIKWIHVDDDSPLANQTLGSFSIRSRTGVTVLGIKRDDSFVERVDADTTIESGDVLVAVGSDENHGALQSLLA